ncbi:TorF family putative porin [Acinetobacter sp. MD2]|uniref:TorF family putative porin n=1 Tax=Acinetobacter sp. MD2 TaxID=2600066 RepID=UPI002D1E6C54|nr:TorF family putative porin [Acinetobacter sp. MD2]MEB3766918.1 hypothetical protein [Acinetobacter sp. MD2]
MKQLIAAAIAVSTLSTATFAEDNGLAAYGLTLTGNVALTSDYRWRGVTQTENDPAIQGSFTLAHSSGLYFSAFASNVDFGAGTKAHLELDPSIGFTTPLNFGSLKPNLDVGLVYYNYPSGGNINWPELYAKLTFADAFVKGDSIVPSISYTNQYGGSEGKVDGKKVSNWNFNLAYSAPFADTGFGGVASVGYSKADKNIYSINANGDATDKDFFDWKVGVTYNVKAVSGLTAELDAVGTNIDNYDHTLKRGAETGAVFTLTKTF